MKHHGQMVSLMTSMAIDRGTVVVVALLVEAEADIFLAMTGGYSGRLGRRRHGEACMLQWTAIVPHDPPPL